MQILHNHVESGGMVPTSADPSNVAIRRHSPTPMHEQLRESILTSIAQNRLAVGDPLPSEAELCESYRVSRTVVRRALRDLSEMGAIQRVQGKGTFVADSRKNESFVQSYVGWFEEGVAQGLSVRSAVRALKTVPAPPSIAATLQLPEGSDATYLDRLRYLDNKPWCVAQTYLPPECFDILKSADLESGSLYAALAPYGLRPERAQRSIEAGMPTEDLIRDLGLRPMVPILVIRSTGFSADARPVEHYTAWHRGDRSRFEFSA